MYLISLNKLVIFKNIQGVKVYKVTYKLYKCLSYDMI